MAYTTSPTPPLSTPGDPAIGLTWDEFLALPYETRHTDLVDGAVIVNPPNQTHELVVRNVLVSLTVWADQRPEFRGVAITQQPVRVNEERGYQPDLAWYPEPSCHIDDNGELALVGLPAIVVEVLSPSTRSYDLLRKRGDYERLGLAEYWVIDPAVRGVLRLARGESSAFNDTDLVANDVLTSPMLPGWSVQVDALFRATRAPH